MVGIFLTLKRVQGSGYVAQTTMQPPDEAAQAALFREKGIPFVVIPLDEHSGWVEMQPEGAFTFRPRGELPGEFSKTELLPGEETTFPNLPAGTKIHVQGPVSAMLDWDADGEEKKDASFGITLPGTYRFIVESFPFERRLFDITVAMPSADARSVEQAETVIGPDAAQMRELAKYSAMRFFVQAAENDKVPATLRAMYVRKLEEAKAVLAGGTSAFIEAEIATRKEADPTFQATPQQWAEVIVGMAAQSDQIELQRMRVSAELDAAPADVLAILGVLAKHKIALETSPTSTNGTWAPM
ncbi:hypothetical protein [Methylobacterium oxalidis]|uniref:Uncharacterized protein n=1 Tax=Methylobacterium oxalidis TaxID=944322 RepID=A0A512J6G4_9HYPH|nr:hypothetical protein [Methylobacterium oxalidis]GEP05575.1 hypothetical protein MOX02_36130 [Methylobacterium oxalidis]GJE32698.1 hypothetical protein LDDCCGHA_2886 [Methylobacterium oxalidis]GLS65444.1 hypothetical protein GCM10007888_38260 [Methylobacterium oxalidis]